MCRVYTEKGAQKEMNAVLSAYKLRLCVVLIAFVFIKLFKVDLAQARGE